jgi:hypothetical protein
LEDFQVQLCHSPRILPAFEFSVIQFKLATKIFSFEIICFLCCSLLHRNASYIPFFPAWLYAADEKVTVLESEKRARESSPEAQAKREALNPWRKHEEQQKK